MKLSKTTADVYIPDGWRWRRRWRARRTWGVGAHQDDLEVFALHGIYACFGRQDQWFTAVTCTDGRGSARAWRLRELHG